MADLMFRAVGMVYRTAVRVGTVSGLVRILIFHGFNVINTFLSILLLNSDVGKCRRSLSRRRQRCGRDLSAACPRTAQVTNQTPAMKSSSPNWILIRRRLGPRAAETRARFWLPGMSPGSGPFGGPG
jgi:hypothetical protein